LAYTKRIARRCAPVQLLFGVKIAANFAIANQEESIMDPEDWIRNMLAKKAEKKEAAKLESQQLNMTMSVTTGMLYKLRDSLRKSVDAYKTLSGDDSVQFSASGDGGCIVTRRIFPVFELHLVRDITRPAIKCMLMTRGAEDIAKKDEYSEIKIVATSQDSYAYRMNGTPEADENVIAENLLHPLLEKL
jgi:hypothetical protein